MTFEEILDQALAMLQRRGRVTYRTLRRQFQLDEDALEDLKDGDHQSPAPRGGRGGRSAGVDRRRLDGAPPAGPSASAGPCTPLPTRPPIWPRKS